MEAGPAAGTSASSPTMSLAATRASVMLGTAGYMSPEQARGDAADRRADIWAFGVVLWELLTGRSLFEGPTVSDTLAAVLRADVDWSALPAGTPAPVRRLLDEPTEDAVPPPPTQVGSWRWMAASALLGGPLAASWVAYWMKPAAEPGAVKFQVPPPEGLTFGHAPVPSPDGGRIAVVAHSPQRPLPGDVDCGI